MKGGLSNWMETKTKELWVHKAQFRINCMHFQPIALVCDKEPLLSSHFASIVQFWLFCQSELHHKRDYLCQLLKHIFATYPFVHTLQNGLYLSKANMEVLHVIQLIIHTIEDQS